jgi:hypothetical protein
VREQIKQIQYGIIHLSVILPGSLGRCS